MAISRARFVHTRIRKTDYLAIGSYTDKRRVTRLLTRLEPRSHLLRRGWRFFETACAACHVMRIDTSYCLDIVLLRAAHNLMTHFFHQEMIAEVAATTHCR